MNRLLAIAESVYDEQIRREPLVADWQNEVSANRSAVLRLRWRLALASTFAISIPRAAFDRLPAAPVAMTMGLAYNRLWPQAQLTTYIVGAASYLSIRRQQRAQQAEEIPH
jgi:hypothetical protein